MGQVLVNGFADRVQPVGPLRVDQQDATRPVGADAQFAPFDLGPDRAVRGGAQRKVVFLGLVAQQRLERGEGDGGAGLGRQCPLWWCRRPRAEPPA